MIYFDNAATTIQKPECVKQAVIQAMDTMGNPGRAAHKPSLDAARVVYETRVQINELFHGDGPEQVAFTMNSTEAFNIALKGILKPGDHVMTTVMEHNSVLRPLYELQNQGVELSVVSPEPGSSLTQGLLAQFEKLRKRNTGVVVCTHGSNLTGDVVDIAQIGSWCKSHHLLLIVDVSQTAGILPIHMQEMGIDIVCFTGHKSLYGPQGTGGLCVRNQVEVKPMLSGGSGVQTFSKHHPLEMPTRLEAGTMNVHGIAGLHAALAWIENVGMEDIQKKEEKLYHQLHEGLKRLPAVNIYEMSRNRSRLAVLGFNIGREDSNIVSDELATEYNIFTRGGGHCAPLMHQYFGTEKQGMVRCSLSYFNTEKEVEQVLCAIQKLCP